MLKTSRTFKTHPVLCSTLAYFMNFMLLKHIIPGPRRNFSNFLLLGKGELDVSKRLMRNPQKVIRNLCKSLELL